ncbi:MAG: magnesium chelatase, partial [Gemmatimonadetes bacterium]|nr:magnesium chelatase [Gemmatimonadota bacterium]
LDEPVAVPRVVDVYAALPAITGKMELEYEGELHGHEKIGRELIAAAAHGVYAARAGGADVEDIVEYFEQGSALQVGEESSAEACLQGFETVAGLMELVHGVGLASESASPGVKAAACELVLEALVAERRVARTSTGGYRRPPHDEGGGPGMTNFDPFGT